MSDDDGISNWSRFAEQTNVSFPGESAEYRAARDRLLEREAELRHATEAVAAARRELRPGSRGLRLRAAGAGPLPTPMRMSELFAPGRDTLLIYSFIFGPDREESCPMCTAFLSPLDPAAKTNCRRHGP